MAKVNSYVIIRTIKVCKNVKLWHVLHCKIFCLWKIHMEYKSSTKLPICFTWLYFYFLFWCHLASISNVQSQPQLLPQLRTFELSGTFTPVPCTVTLKARMQASIIPVSLQTNKSFIVKCPTWLYQNIFPAIFVLALELNILMLSYYTIEIKDVLSMICMCQICKKTQLISGSIMRLADLMILRSLTPSFTVCLFWTY